MVSLVPVTLGLGFVAGGCDFDTMGSIAKIRLLSRADVPRGYQRRG
jgi:hypothetical protein